MNVGEKITDLGKIKLKSNREFVYNESLVEKAEIYVVMTKFSLNPLTQNFDVEVSDFVEKTRIIAQETTAVVKNELGEDVIGVIPSVTKTEFECVKTREKTLPIETVDGLFSMIAIDILKNDSFHEKLILILHESLLFDTRYVPTKTGKLLYNCEPQDFDKC